MAWFTAILQFVASLLDYYRTEGLLSAGKAQERNDVLTKEEEKRKLAEKIKKEISTLPSADVSYKLRDKYKRD